MGQAAALDTGFYPLETPMNGTPLPSTRGLPPAEPVSIPKEPVIPVGRERLEGLDRLLKQLEGLYEAHPCHEEVAAPGSVYNLSARLRTLLDDVGVHLKTIGVFDQPVVPIPESSVKAIAAAAKELYAAVYNRLVFLKGAVGLAGERSELLEDAEVVEATVPSAGELERLAGYRAHLQRAHGWKVEQLTQAQQSVDSGSRDQGRS